MVRSLLRPARSVPLAALVSFGCGGSHAGPTACPARALLVPSFAHLVAAGPSAHALRWKTAPALLRRQTIYHQQTSRRGFDRSRALAQVVNSEATEAIFTLLPDTGLHYFQLTAEAHDRCDATLAPLLEIDTTTRLVFSADVRPDRPGLYSIDLATERRTERSGSIEMHGNDPASFVVAPTGARFAFVGADGRLRAASFLTSRVDPVSDAATTLGPSFAWDATGRWLAYTGTDTRGQQQLFLSAGGAAIAFRSGLVPAGDGSTHDLAPDGQAIVYPLRTQDGALWLAATRLPPPSLQNVPQLVPLGSAVEQFAFAPRATEVAYITDAEIEGTHELFVEKLDFMTFTDRRKRSGDLVAGGGVARFAWSPTGQRLAFLADKERRGRSELFAVPVRGGLPLKVSGTMQAKGDVTRFAWSPDGNTLAFVADGLEDEKFELFAVIVDTLKITKLNATLPATGDVRAFAWSPFDARVAYTADATWDETVEIFTVSRGGTDHKRLGGANPKSPGRGVVAFAWSPVQPILAYVADQETKGTFELFVGSDTFSDKISGLLAPGGHVWAFRWSRFSN